MKTFQSKRRVAHTAGEMYALVADVERYPEFVPLCTGLKVRGRGQDGGREVLTADMTVAYRMFSETFTSRVTLDPAERKITVESLDGPFRHLENRWVFHPAGKGACDVEFFIAYEFNSLTMQMMMGSMFDRAFRKFSEAFETRADQVYGSKADDGAQTGVDRA